MNTLLALNANIKLSWKTILDAKALAYIASVLVSDKETLKAWMIAWMIVVSKLI
jgi:hypothetical protein